MKRHCLFLLLTFAALSFLSAACIAQTTSPREAIAILNVRYFELYTKGDSAVIDLYTDDACLSAPGTPSMCGRAALMKDFKDTYAAGKIKGVKFSTLGMYGNGKEFVTEEGTWQVIGKDDQVLATGKYLKLWKKTSRGWKIFRDFFNSDRN